MIIILDILQKLFEIGVHARTIKEGNELGDNIQTKILAFGLTAEYRKKSIIRTNKTKSITSTTAREAYWKGERTKIKKI